MIKTRTGYIGPSAYTLQRLTDKVNVNNNNDTTEFIYMIRNKLVHACLGQQ